MFLPPSSGYKLCVQARCSSTHYPKFCKLRRETAQLVGTWLFEDVICRWRSPAKIVTDNGTAFFKACKWLASKYHIKHIRISSYNSRANGIVERPHFDVHQALFKAADGNTSKWSDVAYSVFWSNCVTTRKRMGCLPYFAITGCQPIIPLYLAKATYLLPPPSTILSTTDLIASCAIALQKRSKQVDQLQSRVYAARLKAAARFEDAHQAIIKNFNFGCGDLVLMRNTKIEKSLNQTMCPRYLGPLIVVSCNRGGAYIIAELDGSVFDRPIAAFRLIPYLARKSVDIPTNFFDAPRSHIQEMEDTATTGDDEDTPDSNIHEERPIDENV